jgi:regulator of protease activity HflC (stomatin/prohibitin superfamily)
VVAAAKAQAQRTQIDAEAQAQATRIQAEVEAEAIRIKAVAAASVDDPFAREMEMRRLDVLRVKAFGNKTVFIPNESSSIGGSIASGLGMAAGLNANKPPSV